MELHQYGNHSTSSSTLYSLLATSQARNDGRGVFCYCFCSLWTVTSTALELNSCLISDRETCWNSSLISSSSLHYTVVLPKSASNMSATSKGYVIHMLWLVILIIMTSTILAFGVALQWFTMRPSGKLWGATSSKKYDHLVFSFDVLWTL